MAKIKIEKHTRLKDGSLSGFFSVPADKVTESLRMELMRLEGVEADIRPVEVPVLLTEPLSPGDIRMKILAHLRAVDNLTVLLMHPVEPEDPEPAKEPQLCLGRTGEEMPDELPEIAGEAGE